MSSRTTARARKLTRNGAASTNGSSPRKKKSVSRAPKKRAKPARTSVFVDSKREIAILRAMLEHTKDALILFDKEGKVLTFNHSAAELYKKHNKTVLKEGASVYTLVSTDRHEPTKEIFEKVLEGETFERIAKSVVKDKEYFFKRFFNPVYDEAGNIYAVANTITDITVEVEAREKIAQSESKLRTIIESTTDSFVLYDKDFRVIEFNQAAEDMYRTLNHTKLEAGKTAFELSPPDRHDIAKGILGRILEGEQFIFQASRKISSGKELWFKTWYFPIKSEGEVIAFSVKTSDITDEIEAERALKESEANLHALFDNSEHGFALIDNDAHVLAFNKVYSNIFFITNQKHVLKGKSFYDLLQPEHVATMRETFKKVFSGETIERTRKIIDGGKVYYFQGYYNPVKDSEGKIIGICLGASDVTSQVTSQEAIAESEANLRALFDNAKDGFVLLSTQGIILAFNHAAGTLYKKMFGKTLIIGKAAGEVLGPELGAYVGMAFQAVLQGQTIERKSKQIATDDEEYWLRGYYNPVKSSDGTIIGICMGIADITAETEAQEKVTELASIVQYSDDAIYSTGLDSLITNWNSGAEKIFGYSAEEIMGASIIKIFPAEIVYEERAIISKIMNGESQTFTTKRLTKAGKVIDVSLTISPIRNTEGEITGVSRILRDISDEKRLFEEVLESEKRFRVVADTAPVLIWMSDTEKHCSFFNKFWLDFTGKSEEELMNNWTAGIHPDDFPEYKEIYSSAFDARKEFTMEYRLRKADGEYRWLSDTGVPRFLPDGTFLGYIGTCIDVTDRKLVREELESKVSERTAELSRQKELNEKMIDSSVDMIAVYDKDLRLIAINQKSVDLMRTVNPNFKKEHILGKTFDEVNTDTQNTETAESREDLLRSLNGESIRKLYTRSMPQTQGRDYEVYYEPIRHEGEVYASLVIIHDITETMNISEALREKNIQLAESEERYHKMIEDVKDYAIILLDSNGNIQNWNKGAERLKGYSAEEVIGKHFRLFYTKEDQMNHIPEHLVEEARKNGRSYFEGWRIRKDGSTFWASVTLTALHNEKGEIIGFSKVTRDLTDRKFAEDTLRNTANELHEKNEELERQNEYIETLIDSSPDLITVYDTNMRVMTVNKEVEKIIGRKRKDIIGKTYLDLFPGTKASHTYNNLLRCLSGETTHHVIHDADNSDHSFDIYMIPLKLHGKVYAALVLTHDITEIMSISEKLHQTNATLEEKNMELERTNKELEQFAYVASHDLQEPLRKIRTFAGRIQEKNIAGSADSVQEYLQKIVQSSDRMSELIKDILNYSRLSTSNVRFENVDLAAVLKNALSDLDLKIEEKNGVVHSSPLPVIEAIPLYMQQLFQNLLSNALKFTREGVAPEISITASEVSPQSPEIARHNAMLGSGKYWDIIFKDNGIGFSQEFSEKIFVIFQRLNERSKFEGTGVGLALCRKIAEIHHGIIYAKSKEGEGTEFHVILPEKQA